MTEDQCSLEIAVCTGNADIVKLLIDSGCCVDKAKLSMNGGDASAYFRPIDVAIYRNFNDIVEILVSAGFSILKRNGFSESRLHVAACGDNEYVLQKLLNDGVDADEITSSWTACHVLAARNHPKTLKGIDPRLF